MTWASWSLLCSALLYSTAAPDQDDGQTEFRAGNTESIHLMNRVGRRISSLLWMLCFSANELPLVAQPSPRSSSESGTPTRNPFHSSRLLANPRGSRHPPIVSISFLPFACQNLSFFSFSFTFPSGSTCLRFITRNGNAKTV